MTYNYRKPNGTINRMNPKYEILMKLLEENKITFEQFEKECKTIALDSIQSSTEITLNETLAIIKEAKTLKEIQAETELIEKKQYAREAKKAKRKAQEK